MPLEPETFHGVVESRTVARGSKSEREAPVLVTENQGVIILRMKGQGAFETHPLFSKAVGKRGSFTGILHGTTLIVESWFLPNARGEWILKTLERLGVADQDLPGTIGRPTGKKR